MRDFDNVYKYKNHFITITKKKDNYYTANYTVKGQEYYSGNSDIDKILKYFRSNVDKLMEKNMKELTYEGVYKEWGINIKIVTYKNQELTVGLYSKGKNKKAFFIGYFTGRSHWVSRRSFESIHYDKVISKFERFVDEYCTDWKNYDIQQYNVGNKLYTLNIKRDSQGSNYFGTCEIHKNSIFKCISNDINKIEEKFKARIDRVVEEKKKVTKFIKDYNRVTSVLASGARKHKIQELEQLLARISSQLEELKKEKDTLTYKEVVLELVDDPIYKKGILRGVDNPSPFVENSWGDLKKSFESYVDRLETQYNLYRKLTGKEE